HQHQQLFEYYQQRARQAGKGNWRSPESVSNPTAPGQPNSQPSTTTDKPRLSEKTSKPGSEKNQPEPAENAGDDIIVYVTDSGTKYHRADCYHLRKSKRAMKLSEAKARGYEPCSHCQPPK
ncbi:MAG: hypothetical protein ABIG44_13920, partial [Planctomycetota bacterium]